MVGGSTNKLTVAGLNHADKKASTFNAAKFSLVGNNSTGDNIFGRNKRWENWKIYTHPSLLIQFKKIPV
jgi:hypothetical protein